MATHREVFVQRLGLGKEGSWHPHPPHSYPVASKALSPQTSLQPLRALDT